MGVNATGTLALTRESRRRRRENQGAVGGEGVGSGEGLCPFPKKYDFFISKWCDENDSNLRYSKVPLNGKNKPLVKILGGGRQHRTTPAGQILEDHDPCNPCGVDAYAFCHTFTYP